MKYVYPAIFQKDDDGGYCIYFPDLDCNTQGDNLQDAMEMAEDALCLMLYDMEVEGKPIPAPSQIKDVKLPHPDDCVTFIKADTMEYRIFHENKTITKSVTLPSWLNEEAKAKGINFSAELQEALKARLGL